MINVFFTVDTECSLGGAWDNPASRPIAPERAILGKIGEQYYGIPRIMAILERHGLRGVFFLEVFAALNGWGDELNSAFTEITKRGHDVQLHLHPIQYYYWQRAHGELNASTLPKAKDMIGALPRKRQLELLQHGIALFRDLTGRSPQAFRAGNFGANNETLGALAETEITIDSSFNAAYVNDCCAIEAPGMRNAVWQRGKVWEVPVTTYETGKWQFRGLKQLNINAVSLWEMKSVLNQAEALGLRIVTFIAHSFSLFKVGDIRFETMRPDRLVENRLEGLCRYLADHRHRFQLTTFSGLDPSALAGHESGCPAMGIAVPAVRKMAQAIHRLPWL